MKKLLAICLTLAPCALMAASNKIKMVSYFPVPYVAYSRVSADQMDVGLTSACSMKLGCSESHSPLVTPKVNVQSGKLELNGGRGVLGNSITLGYGNTGTGHLAFSNVRMNEGNMESVNANAMAVSNLNLFGRVFPSCKEANSASSGQMSWQALKLKGASNKELYLACGGDTPATCGTPTHNGQETYEEDCELTGGSVIGKKYYKWNPNPAVCDYELVADTCKYGRKYLSYPNNCLRYVASGANAVLTCAAKDISKEQIPTGIFRNEYCTVLNEGLKVCYGSNVHPTLPSGCTAGQPCDACENGHQYVYGIDVDGFHYGQYTHCASVNVGGLADGLLGACSGLATEERTCAQLVVVPTVTCYIGEAPEAPSSTLDCRTSNGTGVSDKPIVSVDKVL